MKNYLKTYYSDKMRPKSDYPDKLAKYLAGSLNVQSKILRASIY